MKIASHIVGCEIAADEQRIDSRWLMAYNAALGSRSDVPHPLFPVCYEWPATRQLRERAGLAPIDARLVHAQHDLIVHRPPRAETLRVSGQVVSVAQKRPGAIVVFRFAARDAGGERVSTTDFTALYRGVELEGGDRSIAAVEEPPNAQRPLQPIGNVEVSAVAAHVYTECARIWNPIHTDAAYARAAGLPDIILHGTATLALSVSAALRAFKADPKSVRRIQCRFSGMVHMPGTLEVAAAFSNSRISFETRKADGEVVVSRGALELDR